MSAGIPAVDRAAQFAASDKAERSVLGACLRYCEAIHDVVLVVTPEDFRSAINQDLFRLLIDVSNAQKSYDLTDVANAIHRRGMVDSIEYKYLADLYEHAPAGSNVTYHAEIVRDASLMRRLEEVGREITHNARHPTGPAREVVEEAEKSVLEVADRAVAGAAVAVAELVPPVMERITSRSQHATGVSGVPTGYPDLDSLTTGLQDGELVVVGARPSVGKTAFSLSLARNACRAGKSVLFASLEQSGREVTERLLVSETMVDGQKVRKGFLTRDEGDRLIAGNGVIKAWPLWIDDSPGQSVLRIKATARRLKRRHSLHMIVIDYLQLISPEDHRAPRQEQVAAISRRLKMLARELNVPVVTLAQLNRGVEERAEQKPRLSDLRESGAIEQDADVVILLHPLDRNPDSPVVSVDVNVAKQRNGPVGSVTLMYRKSWMRFESYVAGEIH